MATSCFFKTFQQFKSLWEGREERRWTHLTNLQGLPEMHSPFPALLRNITKPAFSKRCASSSNHQLCDTTYHQLSDTIASSPSCLCHTCRAHQLQFQFVHLNSIIGITSYWQISYKQLFAQFFSFFF